MTNLNQKRDQERYKGMARKLADANQEVLELRSEVRVLRDTTQKSTNLYALYVDILKELQEERRLNGYLQAHSNYLSKRNTFLGNENENIAATAMRLKSELKDSRQYSENLQRQIRELEVENKRLKGNILESDKIQEARQDMVLVVSMYLKSGEVVGSVNDFYARSKIRCKLMDYLGSLLSHPRYSSYAFKAAVVCDKTNNTPEFIDKNELRVAVSITGEEQGTLVDFILSPGSEFGYPLLKII